MKKILVIAFVPFLTLTGSKETTNAVKVQYIPLPASTDQDTDFNFSMIIQFHPGDFNLDEQFKNSQFITEINNATVNTV